MGKRLVAVAACAFCATAIAGPFDQFKGKMKPGMYETTMDMEMPGMPQGMGKHTMKTQNCVTQQDIEKGQVGKGKDQKSENCDIRNFNMSGNTATYTTVCKQPEMTADTKITFNDAGYKMDMKMAVAHNGQPMNMTQHMEGRYVGPCTK
jgi:uncharacterized protein DUF3617